MQIYTKVMPDMTTGFCNFVELCFPLKLVAFLVTSSVMGKVYSYVPPNNGRIKSTVDPWYISCSNKVVSLSTFIIMQ
jgi:hypothetical protein